MLRWKRTAGRRNQLSPQLREEERRLSFHRSHHLCYHSGFSPANVFFSLNVSSVFTKHVRFAVSWISWSWVSSPLGGGKGLWPKPKCGTTPAGEKFQMKSFRNIHIISLRRSRVRRWMKTFRTLTQPSFRGWTFTIWSAELFYPYSDNFHKPENLQPDGSILSSFWWHW